MKPEVTADDWACNFARQADADLRAFELYEGGTTGLDREDLQTHWSPQAALFCRRTVPIDVNLQHVVRLEQVGNIEPARMLRSGDRSHGLLIQTDRCGSADAVQYQVDAFVGVQVRRAVKGADEPRSATEIAQKILPGHGEFGRSTAGQFGSLDHRREGLEFPWSLQIDAMHGAASLGFFHNFRPGLS